MLLQKSHALVAAGHVQCLCMNICVSASVHERFLVVLLVCVCAHACVHTHEICACSMGVALHL